MAYTGQNPKFNSTVLKDVGVSSIANPASGSHRLINRGGTFQVQDSTGLETAIGAGGTVDKIIQTAHGFSVGEILYYTGTAYARALANAANTSEIIGMVSRVIDANTFEATLEGKVTGLTGLTAGEAYFLSPTVSGGITITEPTVIGHVSLPVGVAISTTVIYVRSSRGAVVGSSNARTEIALGNNTVTNVQSVAAYQAGELTGWVEIDGTTDSKFYVSAPFAKNGAATDYNISPQYVGDTPPVGFLITVTSAGIIQATLPSIAGYVSAKINFALNAPAVGVTLPLSIDSTLVQFSTLKAKDSGGFVLQNSSATQIGSWSNAGGLTAGPAAGSSGPHTIQGDATGGYTAIIQATNASASAGNSNGLSLRAGIVAGDTALQVANRAATVNFALCNGVGVWTLGNPANATFPGNLIVGRKDGSSVPSGYVGEKTSVTIVGSVAWGASSITTTIASQSFSAGTWLIYGTVTATFGSAYAGPGVNINNITTNLSDTNNGFDNNSAVTNVLGTFISGAVAGGGICLPQVYSFNTTTTIYICATVYYTSQTGGTMVGKITGIRV
ncbi:MAG: hypothetical protein RLZZ74_3426 [Cyanobacteriota bacterium]|jgi:hypothetical protein